MRGGGTEPDVALARAIEGVDSAPQRERRVLGLFLRLELDEMLEGQIGDELAPYVLSGAGDHDPSSFLVSLLGEREEDSAAELSMKGTMRKSIT